MKMLALLSLSLFSVRVLMAQIADPVRYYIKGEEPDPSDKFYKLEIDMTGDGKKDILMTSTQAQSDSDSKYFAWTLFLATKNGYAQLGENQNGFIDETSIFGFRMDKYFVGYIPEVKQWGLLVMDVTIPNRDETIKQKATLRAIVVRGNGWVQHQIWPSIDLDDKSAYDALLKRFPNPPIPPIQEVKP
jgi:hypothetical protein